MRSFLGKDYEKVKVYLTNKVPNYLQQVTPMVILYKVRTKGGGM